ncbi:PfkB family carbohydrate kinase [Maricaulis sp.]|uniref:PfkB family carbohydrate kinase n=1 Tax=Maricaulis sp. TaxID=1486257 RepID=UPI003A932403
MTRSAVFAGLCTVDHFFYNDAMPAENEKTRSVGYDCDAGGPAFNAAVTYCILGGSARFAGNLGQGGNSEIIRAVARKFGLEVLALSNDPQQKPATAAIGINNRTGSRTVWSFQPESVTVVDGPAAIDPAGNNCLVLDGHVMPVALRMAREARKQGLPVLLDAGSWKPGFESLLPLCTCVIASSGFRCPGDESPIDYIGSLGVQEVAISRNELPIHYRLNGKEGQIPVEPVVAVDTLGAGDVLHGAFAYFRYGRGMEFCEALTLASRVSTRSVQFRGARDGVVAFQTEPEAGMVPSGLRQALE